MAAENSKNVVLMDIINSILKTGNKTANINVKKHIDIAFLWLLSGFDPSPLTMCINCSFYVYKLTETVGPLPCCGPKGRSLQKLKHFNILTILSIIFSYNAEINATYVSTKRIQGTL